MPQCPFCNAAILMGQRYCSTCDSYLPSPEEEDHCCPQCGIRVAPQQRICHKCKASLLEMTEASFTTVAKVGRVPPWGVGIFIGTGLVLVVLLFVFIFYKSLGPPQLTMSLPFPPTSRQTPAPLPPRVETVPSAPTVLATQKQSGLSAPAPPSPPELTTPVPSPHKYFVNIHYLALRDGPNISAPQIATLNFKEEVELLDTSGKWGKIRDLRLNIVGWSSMRYLMALPVDQQ